MTVLLAMSGGLAYINLASSPPACLHPIFCQKEPNSLSEDQGSTNFILRAKHKIYKLQELSHTFSSL